MSKSVKVKVDELSLRESRQFGNQNIDKICAAMEVQLYWAEKVNTSTLRQFLVCLKTPRQAVTIWSDVD